MGTIKEHVYECGEALERAIESGLEAEFFTTALLNAIEHPEKSISDILHESLIEWDI